MHLHGLWPILSISKFEQPNPVITSKSILEKGLIRIFSKTYPEHWQLFSQLLLLSPHILAQSSWNTMIKTVHESMFITISRFCVSQLIGFRSYWRTARSRRLSGRPATEWNNFVPAARALFPYAVITFWIAGLLKFYHFGRILYYFVLRSFFIMFSKRF